MFWRTHWWRLSLGERWLFLLDRGHTQRTLMTIKRSTRCENWSHTTRSPSSITTCGIQFKIWTRVAIDYIWLSMPHQQGPMHVRPQDQPDSKLQYPAPAKYTKGSNGVIWSCDRALALLSKRNGAAMTCNFLASRKAAAILVNNKQCRVGTIFGTLRVYGLCKKGWLIPMVKASGLSGGKPLERYISQPKSHQLMVVGVKRSPKDCSHYVLTAWNDTMWVRGAHSSIQRTYR